MSKLDELEKKVDEFNPEDDQDKIKEIVKEIKDAHANGDIADDEKTALVRAAQDKAGDNIDFNGV